VRALALAILLVAAPASAAVSFQNTGNLQGWDRSFTQHAGTNTEVATPTFKGPTAIRAYQIYQGSNGGNYHSEVETYRAQRNGEDRYYGQAVYLPPDWIFHDQNVTFQQWAPDDNSGPWILMFLVKDHLTIGRHVEGRTDVVSVADLRGTWLRIVMRLNMVENGVLEVWLNGEKKLSLPGNFTAHGGSIRWSTGIYCTVWDTDPPLGLKEQMLFHDHLRVASTYEEAEPANWEEDGSLPVPSDAGVPADAAAVVADGPADPSPVPDAAAPDRASHADASPSPDAGEEPQAPPPAHPGAARSGCSVGQGGGGGPWLLLAAFALGLRRSPARSNIRRHVCALADRLALRSARRQGPRRP
jgi:MYXO-CTERM domain-containing protein